MPTREAKSVVVIGAGAVGLCCALYAARRGHRCTVVDRASPDGDGCSLGNAGMVVPSHVVPLAAPGMVGLGLRMLLRRDSPFAIRPRLNRDLLRWAWLFARSCTSTHVEHSAPVLRDLHLASRTCFEELDEEGGFSLQRSGLLMLCKSEAALHDEAQLAQLASDLGIPAEVLTPAQAAERDPAVHMKVAGAVYFPLDGFLTPARLIAWLRHACCAAGVEFRSCCEATAWRLDGRRVVAAVTTDGDLRADEFVVAGGSWTPNLARGLGLRLPMQAGKGYSITLTAPPALPTVCSILTEARVAVTPMDGALRFAGTMEIAGLDRSVDAERVRGMIESIPGYLPQFAPRHFAGQPVWSGLRPCSPDGLPYIGRVKRQDNVIVASGHAMMGVSLAPITGRLVAELLTGDPASINIGALSPDRFG